MKKSKPQLLSEFIEAVNEASGCAWQMVHIFQDPRWMLLRDVLDGVKQLTSKYVNDALKPKIKLIGE